MDPTVIYTTLILVLIIFSAFFSLTETAFTSANRIRLKRMANEGDRRAGHALDMLEDYDRFLTTNLIGVNVVNIASTTIASLLFVLLFAELGSLVNIVVMTLVSLTFCEIIPKSVAKKSPEKWCVKTASTFSLMMKILSPISWLFTKLTKAIGKEEESAMSDEELGVLIDECEDGGTLNEYESELIKSAIGFDDIQASELCVPRIDIVAISKDASSEELADLFCESGFTRIPIYEGSVDNIVGMVNSKEYFTAKHRGLPCDIDGLMIPVRYIPETMSVSVLLRDFQRSRIHMAVILDSFGGTKGIVTLEDIVEELIGDIWDESDEIHEDLIQESDGSYRIRGGANIFDVMEKIDIKFDPEGYEDWSVSGYVFHKLKRTPRPGDSIDTGHARIIVRSMDGRRVRECGIRPNPDEDMNED